MRHIQEAKVQLVMKETGCGLDHAVRCCDLLYSEYTKPELQDSWEDGWWDCHMNCNSDSGVDTNT